MEMETVGHTGLFIRDHDGAPVLLTDSLITGSCCWLQRGDARPGPVSR
jgi:hypothetical protein